MRWFNAERLKKILTFPVETVNLLNDGTGCVDKEWEEFTAQMWSEGASFFCYTSDSVDALASCCYTGDTEVVIKIGDKVKSTTFNEILNLSEEDKYNIKVLSNGEYKPCTIVTLPNKRPIYHVELSNKAVMNLTDNHRNNTLDGMKYTAELAPGDYIEVASKSAFNEHYDYTGTKHRDLPAITGKLSGAEGYAEKDGKVYCRVETKVLTHEYDNDQFVYCFQMLDEADDKFTLANGIHNYNCRLRNSIESNVFSYTLGAGGLMTGSKGVITININRLIQNVAKEHGGKENITLDDISLRISEQVSKIHKYLTAKNENLKESLNAKMLPVYDAGYIDLSRQYLTIGVNGFVEGAEFLGIDISPNEDYSKYGEAVLKPIFDTNRKDRTTELMFNTECVPTFCGNLAA